MLIGKSRIGIKTLIEVLLNENIFGHFLGNNELIKCYKSDKVPFIRLARLSWPKTEIYQLTKELVVNINLFIKEQNETNNPNNYVQCIWYCVGGRRLEQNDIELIKELKYSIIK